jgi:predicted NBD/HSP70 family sugar kinase
VIETMTQGVDSRWEVMHAVLALGAGRPIQQDLADLTGLSPRTISNVIGKARPLGHLEGRQPVRLGVGLGMALGISLGTESLRAGLVDANGIVRKSLSDPPRPDQLHDSPRKTMARIRSIAGRLLKDATGDEKLRSPESRDLLLAGAAVAWPSPIDRSKRPRGKALSHEGWQKARAPAGVAATLTERLARALGPPFTAKRCHALNDVSAHALAVAFDDSRGRVGEARDDRSYVSLVIRIGGGLGSGMVVTASHDPRRLSFIDTKLIEGAEGLAGELGHLPVGRSLIAEVNEGSPELAPMDYDAWTCSCGKKRHLEAFASGMSLLRRLRASGYEIPETSAGHADLLSAIATGNLDKGQRDALRDIGRIVGRALVGPILMLDPKSITVTGSLAGREVVDGVRRVRDSWASVIDDSVEIESWGGERGGWAAVRGAGLAVLRRTVYRNFLDKGLDFPDVFAVSASDIAELHKT